MISSRNRVSLAFSKCFLPESIKKLSVSNLVSSTSTLHPLLKLGRQQPTSSHISRLQYPSPASFSSTLTPSSAASQPLHQFCRQFAMSAATPSTKNHASNTVADVTTLFTSSQTAGAYASYRPTYPPILFEVLAREIAKIRGVQLQAADDAKSSSEALSLPDGELSLVIDVACGSGQATALMALPPLNAAKVLGTDVSAAQVAQGKPQKNTFYAAGTPETTIEALKSLNFPTSNIPLVTCAQAFHWFNFGSALGALREILDKEKGVVAIWGYGECSLDKAEGTRIVCQDYYRDALHGFWAPNRLHVEDEYATIEKEILELKAPNAWTVHRVDCGDPAQSTSSTTYVTDFVIAKDMSVTDFCGYLSSWSGYGEWLKRHKEEIAKGTAPEDPLSICKRELEEVYGGPDGIIKATFRLFVLLCRPKSE